MDETELLTYVAPEHKNEVRKLFGALATRSGNDHVATHIEGFAQMLNQRGLLSDEGLKDFLTFHGLTIGEPESTGQSRYELMSLLGHGAMGEVYLGRDPGLKRTVAVKRAHAQMAYDPIALQRFLNEAQVTAQLDHPAIVPVYGLERDDHGNFTYAMKFVRGVTLSQFLDETRRQIEERGAADEGHSLRQRLEAFVPVMNAIAYAHRRGVVHRDLKPDNIMIGSFGQVLVMDWGIARILGRGDPDATSPPVEGAAPSALSTSPKLTLAGSILGTPAYMSPEQAAGQEVGPSSDQYTLGLILQEIVTLELAAMEGEPLMVIIRAMKGLRRPMEGAPRELTAIVAKATSLDKEQRYPSVAAMCDDLKRYLRDESIAADPDRGLRKVTRWVGKHRGLAAGLVAAALVLALFFLWRGQVALAEEREAAELHEAQLSAVASQVFAQGERMADRLHRYEALLEGIVGSASLVLTAPAPPSDAVAYAYREGRSDPPGVPGYAVTSKAYGRRASLRAEYSAAWGTDRQALRPKIDQMARMEPLLRAALLRSVSEASAALPFAEAERRVLQEGVPLVWTYLVTEDGLGMAVPGAWESYDSPGGVGYDHRREDWYKDALATRGPVWTVAADESALGLTVSCLQSVRDQADKPIAVAGADVWLDRFISELLEVPALSKVGAEAWLLDAEGRVIVRSTEKDKAKTATDYAPAPLGDRALAALIAASPSGQRELDGELAVWTRLGSAGMTYLVVGNEEAMLTAVGGAR